MRVTIIGNSGAGKSTLAANLCRRVQAPILDLDTIAWQAGEEPLRRAVSESAEEVRKFCAAHPDWVVEGCYGDLARETFFFHPHLVFLDLDYDQCAANCRGRPFEPHKYDSKEAQDARLKALLGWVRDYYTRQGEMSRQGHTSLFQEYQGPKTHLAQLPLDSFFPRSVL